MDSVSQRLLKDIVDQGVATYKIIVTSNTNQINILEKMELLSSRVESIEQKMTSSSSSQKMTSSSSSSMSSLRFGSTPLSYIDSPHVREDGEEDDEEEEHGTLNDFWVELNDAAQLWDTTINVKFPANEKFRF